MSDWTQDQAKDPMQYLIKRGEDCTGCASLDVWKAWGIEQQACNNDRAPKSRRESAPARRCHFWSPLRK